MSMYEDGVGMLRYSSGSSLMVRLMPEISVPARDGNGDIEESGSLPLLFSGFFFFFLTLSAFLRPSRRRLVGLGRLWNFGSSATGLWNPVKLFRLLGGGSSGEGRPQPRRELSHPSLSAVLPVLLGGLELLLRGASCRQ